MCFMKRFHGINLSVGQRGELWKSPVLTASLLVVLLPQWAVNITGQPRGPRTMKPLFVFDLNVTLKSAVSIDKRRFVLPADVHEAVKPS